MNNINEEKRNIDDLTFVFYDMNDIQQIFKINKDKAYRLVKTKDFPKMMIGNSIRVNAAELKKYIEKKSIKRIEL